MNNLLKNRYDVVNNTVLLSLGILMLLCVGCKHKTESLPLNQSAEVSLSGKKLNSNESKQFHSAIQKLRVKQVTVYSKPDFVISVSTKNKGKKASQRTISVHLKDGFLIDGDYLNAWNQRMKGGKSKVYMISSTLKTFLTKASSKKKK